MSEHTDLEPDERFIDALEQQLREGIRRRARLESPDRVAGRVSRRGTNMLATASLMLLSLTLGATGTLAVVRQDPAPHRDLHLQKAGILLERAQARLAQRRADEVELSRLFEHGVVDASAAATSRQKVARAESEVRRRELDLEETRLTGRAPVDDLTAPVVDDEDFVGRRLEIRHDVAVLERDRAQARLDRMELLAERGVVSSGEVSRVRAAAEEAAQTVSRLQERIALRRSFVGGRIPAAEVELRALGRDAEAECERAERRLDTARTRLERVSALYEGGAVTAGELREARTEARDAESELALANVQLEMIRRRFETLAPPD